MTMGWVVAMTKRCKLKIKYGNLSPQVVKR